MKIFLIILSIFILMFIFALPLLIVERWMSSQKRTRHSSSKQRQRNQRNRKTYANRRKKYIKRSQLHHTLPSLFETIISMQTKIAKSDGSISVTEAAYIKDSITQFVFISQQKGFNVSKLTQLRQRLVQTHIKAKNDSILISAYAQRVRKQHFHTKEQIVQQLINIAIIGNYTQLKESLIFNAGTSMGFNSQQIRRYIDTLRGFKKEVKKTNTKEPALYTILGCKSTDSSATIKKKYRELVKKNHPDLMHAKDGNTSKIELAKKKMQEINLVYEKIKIERGM